MGGICNFSGVILFRQHDIPLAYFIVRWQLADKCPSLMRILSESDNAKHDNYQKEFVIQTMFNLHRRAVEAHAECDDDFKAVAKRVTRGHGPSFARNVECYTDFIRQYSGGPTMPCLSSCTSSSRL